MPEDSAAPDFAAALFSGEERYRALLDILPLPIFVYDAETLRYLAVNQVAIAHYGWSREEFLAMKVTDIRPAEDVPRLLKVFETLTMEPRKLGIWTHRRKDGSHIEVDILSRDATSGGRRARLIIATDVTERRRLEQALRESEARSRAVFEASPISCSLLALHEGVYTDVNEAFTQLTGYTKEDVVGRTLKESLWLEPEKRPALSERLQSHGSIADVELRFRTKQGGEFLGLVSSRLLTIEGKQYVMTVTRDITERRRATEEKQQLLEQLRQSQKMEAVGRLAGGVAHDFNNMLMVITNFTDFLIAETPVGAPARDDLEQIREAASRATGVTRQLLAFSRKQMLQPRWLDPNRLVGELEKMLRALIGEHIELTCALAPGAATIRADHHQLTQVLLNLAINARDAMPGGGRLRLETADIILDDQQARRLEGLRPGPYLTLTVADTGVGMDEETLRRAFEPFFTTKGQRGTGLGLATVYGIVKQSGGHVAAESAPGRGSSFRIYLPSSPGQAPEESPPVRPAADGGDRRVLVVEDEALVREAVREALERSGYRALLAGDGAEAAALVQADAGPIDLLLCDVVMPGQDGRTVARRLQALRPGLRVLFMSGYDEGAIAQGGEVDAAVAFLEKPFTREQLAAKLAEVFAQPSRPA